MAGRHHQLDGHEFEQAPGVGDGQGTLACCSARGLKESDMTGQLNNNNYTVSHKYKVLMQSTYKHLELASYLHWKRSILNRNVIMTYTKKKL